MKKGTKELIENLKENREDFEFYPTSKEMIKPIIDNIENKYIDVLDIGCGTCNFKKYFQELSEEKYRIDYEKAEKEYRKQYENNIKKWEKENNQKYDRERNPYHKLSESYIEKKKIDQYYVIEKSKILINNLDKESIVLGTDFHNTLLIDKPVNTIFCNPPYSEYKNWMLKIIQEGNCRDIYLIIPQRWKEDKEILKELDNMVSYKVLNSFDFLNADRQARAKVDVLYIKKKEEGYRRELDNIEENAFNKWFDETFPMNDNKEEEKINSWERKNYEKQKIKNELIRQDKDKAQVLVQLYENQLKVYFEHFKAICGLDLEILETIGVTKDTLKKAIKQKIINLKNVYWEIAFDELSEITNRLTSDSRSKMLDKFTLLKSVDFTLDNIYSLIIWVIKNSNGYYNTQLVSFYKNLSSVDNVKPYKSNQKLFEKEEWRWHNFSQKASHYTLDYRIICSNYHIGSRTNYDGELDLSYGYDEKIKDFKAIFRNLGFEIFNIEKPSSFGKKSYAYGKNNEIMFEYKIFKNGNMHLKLNKNFTKAMNVEVSRLLGWIKSKEDIKKEFDEEMAKGAEKYFKVNKFIPIGSNLPLLSN